MNIFVNEYNRYKSLLEKTIDQLSDADLFKTLDDQGNSIAVILKHLSGNLLSRFTDFLNSDGEKPWRDRDSEFDDKNMNKTGLLTAWAKAWSVLVNSVFQLTAQDMKKTVTIRGVRFTVEEALTRSLAHFSYHVGQIVFMGKFFKGKEWRYISIVPGKSKDYNRNPSKERGI